MGARPSSFRKESVVEPVVEQPVTVRHWSAQQQAIFDWFESGRSNLVVRARAGTGKTTTILEGVTRAPEEFILLTSFGKRIVNELRNRAEGAEVSTLHALGYTYIRRAWRGIGVVGNGFDRADAVTRRVVGRDTPRQIITLVSKLHTKGREMEPLTFSRVSLEELAWRFDCVPDESWGNYTASWVADAACRAMILLQSEEPSIREGIDYADMIYLPLVHNLIAKDYDMVVVDEAQDMTVSQLELAARACHGRICIVGDDRQAIYGFRGADSGALDRLKTELKAVELPLTVTYRCPQTVVALAKVLVPDFIGVSETPGIVETRPYAEVFTYPAKNQSVAASETHPGPHPGDFVLSRLNAPLVGVTLRLLRAGIPAFMAGRDIGRGIEAIIRKFRLSATSSIVVLLERLAQWEIREINKLAANGRQDLIFTIVDRADTIRAFSEECETVGHLYQHCAKVLVSEDSLPEGQYVLCSSVHKAKGLEASMVFVLHDTFYRFKDSTLNGEEQNCEYVAITRAKQRLVLVTETPGLRRNNG